MCPQETLTGSYQSLVIDSSNRFGRIASEICLTQSTHQLAASKSSGRVPTYLVAEINQISDAPWLDGVVNIFLYFVK